MNTTWQLNRGQMLAKEYRAAVKEFGIPKAAMGRYLGVSPRTAKRYVSGETHVPFATGQLIRCMLANGITPIL